MITVGMNTVTQENNTALGNHMFQYSLCRIIAEKKGYNFYIPNGESYTFEAKVKFKNNDLYDLKGKVDIPLNFGNINDIINNKMSNLENTLSYEILRINKDSDLMKPGDYLKRCFPNIDLGIKDGDSCYQASDSSDQSYNPNLFNIPDFTTLYGFFQTEKYFNGNEDKVRSWFKVNDDINIDDIINKYPIDNHCFIHIRGNDYKLSESWFLPKRYYLDAMDKIRSIKNDISFVIVTDDIISSKELFPELDIISNDVITDFKILYSSKYCIASSSSFSWWATWLSDKIISIAPNNWLNHNTPENGFFPKDIKTNKFIYL